MNNTTTTTILASALPLRLSVMYHPEPLKITPAGKIIRRTAPLHLGHSVSGGSLKRCVCSNWWPHVLH